MIVGYHNSRFIAECSFREKDLPKSAGFRWDASAKQWWTPDHRVAEKLLGYCDQSAHSAIELKRNGTAAALQSSRAMDAEIEIPVPEGLSYMPFQRAGIAYALRKFGDLD